MPRYDDRLKNVLDLMHSDSPSNLDTLFRHFCDILFQERARLSDIQRAEILGYLHHLYPQTSLTTRMETADIAVTLSQAPIEIVYLIQNDEDAKLTGRLWDRVQLTSSQWEGLLPRLPRTALRRLRTRMDLPDGIDVAVDRAWRDRLRHGDPVPYTLEDELESLNTPALQSEEIEDALEAFLPPKDDALIDLDLDALVPDRERAAALFGDDLQATETTDEILDDEDLIELTDTNFLPATDEEIETSDLEDVEPDIEDEPDISLEDAQDAPARDEEHEDLVEISEVQDDAEDDFEESIELDEIADLEDLDDLAEDLQNEIDDADIERITAEVIDISSKLSPSGSADDAELDEDYETRGLDENPQVDDPKIKDILARLREFGSRSRLMSDSYYPVDTRSDAPEEEEENEQQAAGPAEPEATEDEAEAVDASTHDDMATAYERDALGTDALWQTDRFGSLSDLNVSDDRFLGLEQSEAIGQIFSAMLVREDRHALNKALNARRPFRDLAVTSIEDETAWNISAVPVFDDDSGIFLGHRGTATQSSIADQAPPEDDDQPETHDLKTNTLPDFAGLAHELRTPLNAIRGFAEMIETQQLGEASDIARDRSARIGAEVDRLGHVLSDLIQTRNSEDAPAHHSKPEESLREIIMDHDSVVETAKLADLPSELTIPLDGEDMTHVFTKMLHVASLWTARTRNIETGFHAVYTDTGSDAPLRFDIDVAVPGWHGGASLDDLDHLAYGPALPYNHPLSQKLHGGRGLRPAVHMVDMVGGTLRLAVQRRGGAFLRLSLPASVPATSVGA